MRGSPKWKAKPLRERRIPPCWSVDASLVSMSMTSLLAISDPTETAHPVDFYRRNVICGRLAKGGNMTAWEATSFRQWVCSVSVGDIVNLLLALSTFWVAIMAYRIQKTQVKLLKDQTICSLVLTDIARRDKESNDTRLRASIIRKVVDIAGHTIACDDPTKMAESVFFVYSSRNSDNMLFSEKQLEAMDLILDTHTDDVAKYSKRKSVEEQKARRAHYSKKMQGALKKFLQSFEPEDTK